MGFKLSKDWQIARHQYLLLFFRECSFPPILWQLNKNPINDIVKDAARGNFTSDEPAAVSLEDAYCIFEIFEDGGRNAYED